MLQQSLFSAKLRSWTRSTWIAELLAGSEGGHPAQRSTHKMAYVRSLRRAKPLFCESRFAGLKIANRSFEAIRANRWHIMRMGVFMPIDSCGSIRANRPDSRCESLGHLSFSSYFVHFALRGEKIGPRPVSGLR